MPRCASAIAGGGTTQKWDTPQSFPGALRGTLCPQLQIRVGACGMGDHIAAAAADDDDADDDDGCSLQCRHLPCWLNVDDRTQSWTCTGRLCP